MAPTLKHIAELLHLSKTTVSWVLSGKGEERGISPETRERVERCAREIGYQPNLIARSLNTGTSMVIGMIVPSIWDSYFAGIFHHVSEFALRLGYSITLAQTGNDPGKEEIAVHTFLSKKVDALIVASSALPSTLLSSLQASGFPIVYFDRYLENTSPCISIDDRGTAHTLVEHLIRERGCRNIAMMTTNTHHLNIRRRQDGYRSALEENGIRVNERLVGVFPYTSDINPGPVLEHIFADNPDVDGIFFVTHALTTSSLVYLAQCDGGPLQDKNIPMASIHHDPLFRSVNPRFDYADFPMEEMSRAIMDTLLKQIRKEDAPTEGHLFIPPKYDYWN